MGSLFAITTILAAAFLMQTVISVPVGDQEAASFDDLEDLCPCPKCYDPVCGSDNNTYANQCLFDCAKQHKNPNLEVQFHGDCDGNNNQFTISLDACHFAEEDDQIDNTTTSKEEDSA